MANWSTNPLARPATDRQAKAQLRDVFRQAFDDLGGAQWLVDFAARNDGNARCFVQCVSKLLPQNVEMHVASTKLENMTDQDLERMSLADLTKFIIDAEYEVIQSAAPSSLKRVK